jgi:ATP-binding protein involved in chromosome partitioning
MEHESHAVSPISAADKSAVSLRIAIPVADGKLSPHFGHCTVFALFEVRDKQIVRKEIAPAPAHQPGMLPNWLHEKGANVLIAGGIGMRAKVLLEQSGIQVIIGVAPEEPETVVYSYLAGTLQDGANLCDH